MKGLDELMMNLAPDDLTLLDGELVYHETTLKPTFLISDILFFNGDAVHKFNFLMKIKIQISLLS